MNKDVFMKTNKFEGWDYSLMYDAEEKEYVIAEVYFNSKGDPASWCKADIANTKIDEMKLILKRLLFQAENGYYFISKNNKISKHKGGVS